MSEKVLGGALGDCVHVAGILNFLRLAESQGYRTEFTGPATSIADFIDAAREVAPDMIAISYRLTPENAAVLFHDLQAALREAGLSDKRLVFGGTPPVAAQARKTGMFDAVFSGEESTELILAYLKGVPLDHAMRMDYPDETIARMDWKSPYPLLRHHFGIPAESIEPTVEGIRKIAAAHVLDIISLGADQDAQEHFFHPERQDAKSKGAGGVPFRSEDDLLELHAATQTGNYPLMRSYSGTSDLVRYAELLRRTIHNAWCATSLFWFNIVDGRGPLSLRDSIADHMALMTWHGDRDIPVEGNEPHHWELRDGHDAVACAAAYVYAYVARRMGVREYICQYMFETPPHLSNRMDLAKMLAKIELAESQAGPDFSLIRQTRTGLMSYPVNMDAARAQLAASVYLQMALRPNIVHVVGYSEANHAATAEDVIESCRMAQHVINIAQRGMPDMTVDPDIRRRKDQLVEDAMTIVDAIRQLGAGKQDDPLLDPAVLARAVKVGLLDAPHLRGNPNACGRVRTRIVGGANLPVDEHGNVLPEKERVERVLAEL